MEDTPDDCSGPVNLGNPDECTILELAQTIVHMTGSRSEIIFKPLPGDDPVRRRPDITLAREILGWEPATPLQEGLAHTIAYFEEQIRLGLADA